VPTLGVNPRVHDLHQLEENLGAALAFLDPRNLSSVLLEVPFAPSRDVDLESVASGYGDNLLRNGPGAECSVRMLEVRHRWNPPIRSTASVLHHGRNGQLSECRLSLNLGAILPIRHC
jgi:hypothetical protein